MVGQFFSAAPEAEGFAQGLRDWRKAEDIREELGTGRAVGEGFTARWRAQAILGEIGVQAHSR